jgi:putative nucleotidyltransferase with HDIG domain
MLSAEYVSLLADAIKAADVLTYQHCLRTAVYGRAYAQYAGLPADCMYCGMLLHDIGKIFVPASIISGTGKLSDSEYGVMRRHAIDGYVLASALGLPQEVLDIIKHHHERWDGSGYPYGLKGEEIPAMARVAAVIDAFDAMTSYRAYRQTYLIQAALDELKRNAGSQFNPGIVRMFTQFIQENI